MSSGVILSNNFVSKWTPPPDGWMMANVDVAIFNDPPSIGTRNNRGVAAYGQCVCFRVRVIGWVCRLAMRRCSCRYIYLCVFIYLYLRHILQVCYVICVSSFQVFICVTWCTCMCECTEYHVPYIVKYYAIYMYIRDYLCSSICTTG